MFPRLFIENLDIFEKHETEAIYLLKKYMYIPSLGDA